MRKTCTVLAVLMLAGAVCAQNFMIAVRRVTGASGDYLTDLAHRWTFDSDLTDSVGSADFTAIGNAAASGGYLVLDGTGDGLSATNAVLALRTNFTFAAWVQPVNEAQDHDIFVFQDHSGGNTFLWIDEAATDTLAVFVTEDPGNSETGTILGEAAFVRDGSTWTHTAVTFNGTTGTTITYVNGSPDQTNVSATVNFIQDDYSDGFYIGRPQDGTATKEFNGSMDDIRVYSTTLSASQIEQIYDATTP